MKKKVETIDMTPTWSGLLEGLLAMHENGTIASRKLAREELDRMARLADAYGEAVKSKRLGAP